MKRLVLLILVSAVALLRADPTPSLIWTGTPAFTDTSNGIEVDVECGDVNCGGGGGASRTFTVTSPGEFALGTSMVGGFSWYSCYPFGPEPCSSGAFGGEADGYSDVSGPDGAAGYVPVSQSGIGSCSAVAPAGCIAGLNLSALTFDIIYLATGDYTMDLFGEIYAGDAGFPGGGVTFDAILAPYPTTLFVTPEPRGVLPVLAAGFLILLLLNAKRLRKT